MDHTDITQLSSGQYSQALCSTGESTSSRTNESSHPNKSTSSDHEQKFDIFLSHSGKQKDFVRWLHRELTESQGLSCFFDEERESLPVAEYFPPRIFEAAKTCKVAVLLLSKDFLQSKWPMLELSAFVEARDTNPNLKILPVFFLISPDDLKNITELNEKWKQLEISPQEPDKWGRDLRVIRGIKGLPFKEGDNEVEFTEKIVKEIWHILPTSPRYHAPCMRGEVRMCQRLANFFTKVQPNEKGIRIAGLYEIAGHGKTTLGKAFCKHNLGEFEGKVCHLEFSGGHPIENIRLALEYLAKCRQSYLQRLTNQDQAEVELYRRMKGQRVLLVLDNITEENIDEVKCYLKADLGKNSCILLSARSEDVLVRHFNIKSESCMRVPGLEEEEAIAILLERTSLQVSALGAEDRGFALKCANRCLFKESNRRARIFHPLALKAFGSHLFSKYSSDLSKWVVEIDGLVDRSGYGLDDMFAVLGKTFDDMCPKYRTIFMLLTVYMLPDTTPYEVTEWMAINCNEEISFIEKAVEDLRMMAFIEEFKPEIRIHDLYIEFAQSKAKEMGRWLWWKGDPYSTRGSISQDNAGFELVKLEQCVYRNPSQIAPKHLKEILVLQLVGVQNMRKLDLGRMDSLRSITLLNCEKLAALQGMEELLDLAWLQIRGVNPMFKLPKLSSLIGLQHLEIDIAITHGRTQLGDLTVCFYLREIKVRCPSLSEFPKVNGLPFLKNVEFSSCDKVKGPLDCTECVELHSIVVDRCSQMAASPLLAGCKKLSKIVLRKCGPMTACPDIDVLYLALAWLQIRGVNPMFKLHELSSLIGLQYLEIDIAVTHGLNQLGDLTNCFNLREINVRCPCLSEFPRVNGLPVLEKVEFSLCDIVKGPLDCTECVKLHSVVLDGCSQMAASPLLAGCKELSKIVLRKCDAVTACPEIDVPSALKTLELFISSKAASAPKSLESCNGLENLRLWNMGELKELPSFSRLSNLTVLVLGECGIREPPDLTCCVMLEDVDFFKLQNLVMFPNFSLLRKLKKLSLSECPTVQDPPDISGCQKLQVFHLVHNDNMEGLPKMGGCPLLQEIKLSWHSEDGVTNEAIDPHSWQVDDDGESLLQCFRYEDLQNFSGVSVPEALKELQWPEGISMQLKQYFRGGKLYYSITVILCFQKMVLKLSIEDDKSKRKALRAVAVVEGVDSVSIDMKEKKMTIIGDVDPVYVTSKLRKFGCTELLSVTTTGLTNTL